MKAGDGSWRPGILAELGRILDDDDLRAWALRLCEDKPKTKAAVALIRQWRLGKSPTWDRRTVLAALAGAVDNFNVGHPGVPQELVAAALRDLAGVVEMHNAERTDSMTEGKDILARWERPGGEEVRLTLDGFKGKTYLALRLYFTADDGQMHPTKKGVSLRAEEVAALAVAVHEAAVRLRVNETAA